MIRTLKELSGDQWSFIWSITGGDENCEHAYEEFAPIKEDEYTAQYRCLHCDALLDYDVSDIGD
jgi:hypothetical protein